MRFKFPTLILAPAVLAAAALAINPAMAETKTLKIPFSFTVEGKSLPAGLYTVQRDHPGSFVKLQSMDLSQSFTWLASPSATKTDRVILHFEEQGQTHVLQSVQYGALETPRLTKNIKGIKGVIEEISPAR